MGNITWTKSWSASDNGTVFGGADIQNIQNDITTVINGGLTNANVNATAAIVESKIAFDTSAGHDHDGTDSKSLSIGFVDRGDPAAVDYAEGDLTTDATWNTLDLSSVVPANAVAVLLHVILKDDAVGSEILFREYGNTNTKNISNIRSLVANVNSTGDVIVVCDGDRVIEYYGDNLTFATIDIVIGGWWLKP